MLQFNPWLNSTFANAKINITDNLTPFRKKLFKAAKLTQQELKFKFLWTSQGRIRLRQDSESRIINVTSFSDLDKLRYSGPGMSTDVNSSYQ